MAGRLEPITTARAGEVVRLPPGSRDILPEEAAELRAITGALTELFSGAGYGEVRTPALEYADVLARGILGDVAPSYRMVDDHGAWLELRSDMTVPLARVAATRYAGHDGALRFWYTETAYRPVPALQGRSREVLQSGVELFGVGGSEGDAELLTLAAQALERVGLTSARLVVGDARLSETILAGAGVGDATIEAAHRALVQGEFVLLERLLAGDGVPPSDARELTALLRTRGSSELLTTHAAKLGEPGQELAATIARVPEAERGRIIVDLGLVRDLGYYSGLVFQALDPAVGEPIGGGGRYDELVGRFGEPRPAVGFALAIDSVHRAQAAAGGTA